MLRFLTLLAFFLIPEALAAGRTTRTNIRGSSFSSTISASMAVRSGGSVGTGIYNYTASNTVDSANFLKDMNEKKRQVAELCNMLYTAFTDNDTAVSNATAEALNAQLDNCDRYTSSAASNRTLSSLVVALLGILATWHLH